MTPDNPKLSKHGWGVFPGWTVLFDKIDGTLLDPSPAQHAIKRSAQLESLAEMGTILERLAPETVAVLPPSSYHVTLCDGIDVRMLVRAQLPELERLGSPGELTGPLGEALNGLLAVAAEGCTFALAEVVRKNFGVTVRLQPTPGSAPAALRIEEARAPVQSLLSDLFGWEIDQSWWPHISLGYMRMRSDAENIDRVVGQLNHMVTWDGETVHASGAGVYQFETMAAFTKRALPGSLS